jgi:hypothetical protein
MNLEMLREVIPMLRQQLEKSQIDRNYVQLERVSGGGHRAWRAGTQGPGLRGGVCS